MRKAKSPVPALERGFELLRILAQSSDGARALELERTLAIPRSSLYRILRTAMDYGFVTQSRVDGRYYLSNESMAIGFAARAAYPLLSALQPVMQELARSTGLMSQFVVSVGEWRLMVLETWQSERTPVRVLARPGMYVGLNHLGSSGLCFLVFDGDRRLRDYMTLAARESRDLPQDFEAQCARWRQLGYCFDTYNRRHTRRLSAPVFDPRSGTPRLLGVLGVVGDDRELTGLRMAKCAQILMGAARKLERAIAK